MCTIKSHIHKQQPGQPNAFTLVELMVVVLVLGALAFVAIPRIGNAATTAKVTTCRANIKIINQQAEIFKVQTGAWPANWNLFKVNTAYFPDGIPVCPFGTSYSMDGGTHHINPHSH